MRRFAICMIFGSAFVIFWFTTIVVLGVIGIISEQSMDTFGIPLDLPIYVLNVFFGWDVSEFMIEGRMRVHDVLIIIYVLVFNFSLYGLLFFLIISIFKKRKTYGKPIENNLPPKPPTF